MLAHLGQLRADHHHLDGGRRAETHHLADDVARLETEGNLPGHGLRFLGRIAFPLQFPLRPGDQLVGQRLAQPLAQLGEVYARPFQEPHADLPVVRAAHEQQHVVGRRVGGRQADVAHRDRHLVPGLLVDDLQHLDREFPRDFVLGPRRRGSGSRTDRNPPGETARFPPERRPTITAARRPRDIPERPPSEARSRPPQGGCKRAARPRTSDLRPRARPCGAPAIP